MFNAIYKSSVNKLIHASMSR